MNTNFDEKQAFEDLRGILSNIYQFANYYYSEMKTAQKSNNEKISEITNLKSDYEAKLQAKDNKISALETKIFEQEESFKNHLQEYGNYNFALTRQLENLQSDLKSRKEKLDARAIEIQNTAESLKSKYDALVRERADFETEKKFLQEKLSNYEALQKAAENFDAEKQTLQNKISDLEQQIKNQSEIDTSQETIYQLNQNIKELKTQVENLKRQLKDSENELQNLQAENKNTSVKFFGENNSDDGKF